MKKISTFDIVMIIAFVVISLLGGGAWYYLSGQLAATQQDVSSANSDFLKYSSKEVYLPTKGNVKTLQTNIGLLQAELDPLIHDKLQAPGDKLGSVVKEDTVAWKHDLDAEVSRLNTAAKVHGVNVPPNFYYGFSRYLNQNPGDEQTVVLSKQLLGVEQLANIFIDSSVRSIQTFRRTYEEDSGGINRSSGKADLDVLPGRALSAPGDIYTAYPFEIEFNTSTESFRKVVDGLEKSPYIFVLRSVMVQNSSLTSPQISELDKLAGSPGGAGSNPGNAGAPPEKGPQFLFGDETLHIKVRIDMIEWNGEAKEAGPASPNRPGNRGASRAGAGNSAAREGNR